MTDCRTCASRMVSWALLVAVGATAGGLWGCRRAAAPAEGRADRTTVTWMLGVDIQRRLLESLVAEFEQANPDVDVKFIWVPASQYQTKLKTLIAARDAPDLVYCGDVWVAYLLPFLRDLPDFVRRDADEIGLDDFYPRILRSCQHDGRYYFLPRWFNISLLYYNRKLFDQANQPYPTGRWTWQDYVEAGRKLTRRGPDGKVQTWGSDIVLGWWGEWLILVRQSGGRLFSEDLTRCLLAGPQAIRGLEFYRDKVYRWGISPRPGYGPENGFASGKVGMLLGGHTGTWPTYNALPDLDWDIQVLPRGPATRAGGEIALDALGISKTSRQPEAAWRLLKFLTGRHSIRRHVQAGYLSVRRSVAQELLLAPTRRARPRNIAAVYQALPDARAIPRSPDYIELAIDIIQPEIDRMMREEADVAATCRRAAAAADAFIEVLGNRRGPR